MARTTTLTRRHSHARARHSTNGRCARLATRPRVRRPRSKPSCACWHPPRRWRAWMAARRHPCRRGPSRSRRLCMAGSASSRPHSRPPRPPRSPGRRRLPRRGKGRTTSSEARVARKMSPAWGERGLGMISKMIRPHQFGGISAGTHVEAADQSTTARSGAPAKRPRAAVLSVDSAGGSTDLVLNRSDQWVHDSGSDGDAKS
mmetsp:Transcript_10443/g.31052  ORF Transcript_10443/g.31052 Transcript_10443/m.31052 type:complete len:202 (-) Transcript_10443:72-677(-)